MMLALLLILLVGIPVGLNTMARKVRPLPSQGLRPTRHEILALAASCIFTPFAIRLVANTGYAAILFVPFMAVISVLATVALARSSRPMIVATIANLPFAAVLIWFFCRIELPRVSEVPFNTLAAPYLMIAFVVLVLSCLLTLPAQVTANRLWQARQEIE